MENPPAAARPALVVANRRYAARSPCAVRERAHPRAWGPPAAVAVLVLLFASFFLVYALVLLF
ncbi:hypothetical protein ABZ208_03085 [Streptomyces sp. NPDC006208]|uniref:hypothetical protein n=1 Tax=Streptomyces sp. NPDC006208 TaxID=3156734 RepID=UPI0033A2D76B